MQDFNANETLIAFAPHFAPELVSYAI